MHYKLVELTNGCICCTLREDLLDQITNLTLDYDLDYIIIESTGVGEKKTTNECGTYLLTFLLLLNKKIGEPLPIAETFTFGEIKQNGRLGKNRILNDIAKLDTMVTVGT